MTKPVKNYTPRSPRTARRYKRTHPDNHNLMVTAGLLRLAKRTGNTGIAAKTQRALKELNSGMVRKLFNRR
jgi:hypothetical protein